MYYKKSTGAIFILNSAYIPDWVKWSHHSQEPMSIFSGISPLGKELFFCMCILAMCIKQIWIELAVVAIGGCIR